MIRASGTRPGGRCRAAVAAVAASFALLPLAVAGSTASADVSPTPSPSGPRLPVAVTLAGVRPLAPQPGQTLRLRGGLQNNTAAAVSDLAVHLAVSRDKIGTRGEFDTYAATPDGPPPAGAVALTGATSTVGTDTLPAGGDTTWSVSVDVDDLHLPSPWQVYELAVTVSGLTPLGSQTVGQLRTFLPWAPLGVPGVGYPADVAWVWPLVDEPRRTVGGIWTSDALAGELSPDGRLGGLLQAAAVAGSQHPPPPPKPRRVKRHTHKAARRPAPPPRPTITPVPVTWAIDPMLVEGARQMAAGYHVGDGDSRRDGTGRAAAQQWLAKLGTATDTGAVLPLPYADPDVTAAVRSGLATKVQEATTAGQALLKNALGGTPLTYAWPPNGLIDQRALDVLYAAGRTAVVLDSSALPPVGGEPNETPGAHTTVTTQEGNRVDVALADHGLDDVVADGARSQGPLAVQRLMSELLMIQAEDPFVRRPLVITPPRRWAPAAAYAAALLADTGRVPWVHPVTLSDVLDGPTYDKVSRGLLTFPAYERDRQLSRAYLRDVRGVEHRIGVLAAVLLPPGTAQAHALDTALLRLLSSAWRDHPLEARAQRAALRRTVAHQIGQVYIASQPGSYVTLTSHSGIVPVTVANDLDTPVKVVVGIAPSQQLAVKGGGVTKTIQPHHRLPVDVRATAKASGVFPLTVSLFTPGPGSQRYGKSVQLYVRSTAYGATALLITGGATAVLLLAVAVRLTRRGLAARRAASTD